MSGALPAAEVEDAMQRMRQAGVAAAVHYKEEFLDADSLAGSLPVFRHRCISQQTTALVNRSQCED